MSNFRQQKLEIKDEVCMIDTLKEMGFDPKVSESKQTVRGHGSEAYKAEIVLKKEDLKDGGDIGFNKTADGYSIVMDTYVMRKKEHNMTEFSRNFKVNYAKNLAKKVARNNKFKLSKTTTTSDGKIRMVFTEA